jgi:hypothetical protein
LLHFFDAMKFLTFSGSNRLTRKDKFLSRFPVPSIVDSA